MVFHLYALHDSLFPKAFFSGSLFLKVPNETSCSKRKTAANLASQFKTTAWLWQLRIHGPVGLKKQTTTKAVRRV